MGNNRPDSRFSRPLGYGQDFPTRLRNHQRLLSILAATTLSKELRYAVCC
jgi:hypothetical protein